MRFDDIPRDRWEACFGKWDPERFRQAVEEQKRGKAGLADAAASRSLPAIHGDNKGPQRRMYHGFDYGLGREIHGRADRKRAMAELGVECVG
jgi:hypothetical protein